MKVLGSVALAAFISIPAFAADAPKLKDGKLSIEAEKGKINKKMKLVKDAKASAGVVMVADKGGEAVYEFIADEAGDYVIWGRVLGATGTTDSFFVIVNDEKTKTWDISSKTYTWRPVINRGDKSPKVTLKKSKNTIKIKNREAKAKLDKLYIAKPGQKPPKK